LQAAIPTLVGRDEVFHESGHEFLTGDAVVSVRIGCRELIGVEDIGGFCSTEPSLSAPSLSKALVIKA
jgi:hypothetical protein